MSTIIGGTLRGERIHTDCAKRDEALMTWMAFWRADNAPDEPCARCGKTLRERP